MAFLLLLDILRAMFMGLIQGITEFLPVSSSGHLALAHIFFGTGDNDLFFDVLLHVGTLVGVVVYYANDIKAAFKNELKKWFLLMIAATVPAVAAELLLGDLFAAAYTNQLWIGCAFLITAVILFFGDNFVRVKTEKSEITKVTWLDALLIGLAQAVAILPGISRSGSTITVGLFRGLNRKFAVQFSFFMSIIAILGGLAVQTKSAIEFGTLNLNILWISYLFGAATAGLVGYFAVKWLSEKLKTFKGFSIYLLTIGVLTIALTFM
jgi:undecaprenyl-diphosphatase